MAASPNLMADEPGYRLWLDVSLSGRMLTVVPHVAAPAQSALRYQIASTKHGKSGESSTTQSGGISVGKDGSGSFAKLSLGVDPGDRYTIAVKVFDGGKLVAEETLRYPLQ